MTKSVSYKRLLPTTEGGYAVQIIITYSSFDFGEIDKVETYCKENIGTTLIQKNCTDLQQ